MSFAPPTGSRRFAKSYKDSCTGQADGVRLAIRETARQRRLHGGRVEEAAASGELGELIETAQRFQRENETLRALLRRVKVESGAAIADLAATVSRLESDRDALRLERDECRAELCGNQIFKPTSMYAYATVSTQDLWLCFENSTRAIDSSKNQPNRLRFDRDREV